MYTHNVLYMSLCSITFLTSFEQWTNSVWMFLEWTQVGKNVEATPFVMELRVILCNFWLILKKNFFFEITRLHSFIYHSNIVSGPCVETSCVFFCIENIVYAEMWA